MTRTFVRLLIFAAALAFAAAASAQGLDPGEVFVGASKVSIEPRPNALLGKIWERDEAKCELGLGLDPMWVAEHAPALAREPELHLPRRLRDRPDERAHQLRPAVRPVGPLGGDLGRHRHRGAHADRRHLLPRALQEHVYALRRVLARGRPGRRAAHRAVGIHHLRHAQPRLSGLHRRLGRRTAVVHGPGDRRDSPVRARGVREPAARAARGRRQARARPQQRAPQHLLVRRGPDAVLVPRDRSHAAP